MRKRQWFAAVLACIMFAAFAAQADAGTFAVVTGTSSLNVRSGPGTGVRHRLGSVPSGSWVSITDAVDTWRIADVVGSALSGYMSAGFLKSVASFRSGYSCCKQPHRHPVPESAAKPVLHRAGAGDILQRCCLHRAVRERRLVLREHRRYAGIFSRRVPGAFRWRFQYGKGSQVLKRRQGEHAVRPGIRLSAGCRCLPAQSYPSC